MNQNINRFFAIAMAGTLIFTGSSLTAGSLLGSFVGNTDLSGAGSLGTLLAAGKGENLSGEDWSNMVQILRLQMMMNMGKDTGTLI